ncbi:MAG: hypothetical protein P4M11_13405, partial [Candidatus Pacebacteria bacterium]|nr:hypothetical protein [Candidatus Paceibacterota bacterium]
EEEEEEKGEDEEAAAQTGPRSATILTARHLQFLQAFVDSCACPSDIGRIPSKIASNMSSFKAIEWRNWIVSFAVPALRALKAECPDSRLNDAHLNLIKLLQEVTESLQRYTVSVKEIDEMHRNHIELYELVETLFTSHAVKSNLHLHIHLREMLLDYGPAGAWSCYAYERLNGLLASIPLNFLHLEASSMRRFLLLLGAEEHVHQRIQKLKEIDEALRDGISPSIEDFEEILTLMNGSVESSPPVGSDSVENEEALTLALRTDASGRRQLWYQWNPDVKPNQLHPARLFELQRRGLPPYETFGHEPYPGRLHGRMRWIDFEDDGFRKEYKKFIQPAHFKLCLERHYVLAYETELRARYAPAIGNREIRLEETISLLTPHLKLHSTLRVYPALWMGGELWGSALSGTNHRSSYVAVHFRDPHQDYNYRSYGQVQFFFEHSWYTPCPEPECTRNIRCGHASVKIIKHTFAVLRYFVKKTAIPRKPTREENIDDCPILLRSWAPTHFGSDVLPIHRLMHRWIPARRGNHIHVCPISSRLHA